MTSLLAAALVSGLFYSMVIKTLLTSHQTPRKVALVRAFVLLYVLWLACFVPYDILELYYIGVDNRLTSLRVESWGLSGDDHLQDS